MKKAQLQRYMDDMDRKNTNSTEANPIEQGRRIIKLRKLTHLSRRAFGNKYSISAGTLQNWESGRYRGLSKMAVEALLRAFMEEGIKCSADWLLYGSGETPHKVPRGIIEKTVITNASYQKLKSHAEIIAITQTNAEKQALNRKMYEATVAGRYAEVVRLVEEERCTLHLMSGIDIHLYDNHENTLIHVAAQNGNLDIVKFLLEKGTKVDVRNRRKQTALHWAAHNGYNEIIDYLIQKDANIDAVDDEGGTPLSWASYVGQLKIAKQLVDYGANIHSCDMRSYTSLHWACYQGRQDITQFLLERGADPNKKTSNGHTSIDLAIENGHLETVKCLLKVMKENK